MLRSLDTDNDNQDSQYDYQEAKRIHLLPLIPSHRCFLLGEAPRRLRVAVPRTVGVRGHNRAGERTGSSDHACDLRIAFRETFCYERVYLITGEGFT
jgi:hypothetical protein